MKGGSDHEHNSLDTNRANNVAGVSTFKTQASVGSKISDVEYTIFPNSWLQVRAKPDASSKVIGYTRRVVGVQYGEEYWGGEYFPSEPEQVAQDGSGDWMGKWIKSMVPVWELTNCSKRDNLCEEGKYYPIIDESGTQKYEIGYIWELEVMVNRVIIDNHSPVGEVLGDTASSVASFGIESDGAVEAGSQPAEDAKLEALSDEEYILKLLESSASSPNKESKKVSIPAEAQKEAVVNSAFLKVLGFKDENPVGKEFDVSFIVTGDYLDSQEKVESDFTSYKIVGVVPGDESPFFYVPLKDVVHLGVKNYSQTKVVSVSKEKLPEIREKIESLGFITASVADTVAQINSLFGTVRLILALLGGVALGVASLGMFNTLTISLLERTREVGLMKAMGMTADEVKRLFLTESMLMGYLGGMIGLGIGFIAGKIVSLLLSVLGFAKGAGFIDVSFIPGSFLVLIFILSLVVGLITGIYPSKRATKISALDALRYE
ncbi:MAG: hypothetical protein KatS3mg087_1477 [Patescibacteria group bacterium]|nr:MAG: hypothetical protein KatS3mg087_1477 [Patescibacteria group bacterium]